MRWFLKLILQILANAVGIFVAAYFIKDIKFTGDWLDYLIIGTILAVANLIIRPILKIITAPLMFITLGLFIIVINAVILFGVDWFVEELQVTGLFGYLFGSIILSIINGVILGLFKKKKPAL
jgi:putative membrane protein